MVLLLLFIIILYVFNGIIINYLFGIYTSTGMLFAISFEGWLVLSMFDHYFFNKRNEQMKRLSEVHRVKLLTLPWC